jgi:hypothetical protein
VRSYLEEPAVWSNSWDLPAPPEVKRSYGRYRRSEHASAPPFGLTAAGRPSRRANRQCFNNCAVHGPSIALSLVQGGHRESTRDWHRVPLHRSRRSDLPIEL